MHVMGQDLTEISPHPQERLLMYGMTFFWITSMYLYEFNIPSTGTSDPTPQKLNNTITFSLGWFCYLIEVARAKLLTITDHDISIVLSLHKK